jgi:acetyltransferase-like isoleucine patch superfamily enzyme
MPSHIDIANSAELTDSNIDASNVVISAGAKMNNVQIRARNVRIGSVSSLRDCKLFSDGTISVGHNTTVKERTVINAFRSISIGNHTIIDRDVLIGGMQSEASQFKIGNNCVVLYRSYINTTRTVMIGNDVGIGGYCLLFTHSSWQNALNGNPYLFASIAIRDEAWLPWNVTVLPGVTIGKGVTVGTGSVVTKNLSPGVFAAGVPARVIKKARSNKLEVDAKHEVMLNILSDFYKYASKFLKLRHITYEKLNSSRIIAFKDKRLVYGINLQNLDANDTIISFQIPSHLKRKFEWIELDSLTCEGSGELANHLVTFMRRYGIRIIPK